MNFFEAARLEQQENGVWLRLAEGVALSVPEEVVVRAEGCLGRTMTVGIRPEHLEEGQAARRRHGEGNAEVVRRMASVKVEVVEHLGNEQLVYGMLAGKQVLARVDARTAIRPGDEIELYFDMQRIHLFDPDDEHCITSRPPEPSLGLAIETSSAAPSSKGAN
jgi:multiple sugar transport system ATP-binding protein